MIIGIGNDVTSINRIKTMLDKHGQQFENRCFTKIEKAKAHSRSNAGQVAIAATYAKRYAAKEACSKALGTGIGKKVSFKDMEISNDKKGLPSLTLSGNALKYANKLIPQDYKLSIHLSLSDENDMAWAVVIISAKYSP